MNSLKQALDEKSTKKDDNRSHLSKFTTSTIKYLWIDCVDSYDTPNEIIGILPEEILLYKNLAHQVNYTDLNCLSVLQYAIQILKIEHIIICGHYDCRVLKYAPHLGNADLVEMWLQPLRDIYMQHAHWLEMFHSEPLRLEKLCELNVIEQVMRVCNTNVVQNAWKRKQKLAVHGWVYAPDHHMLNNLTIDIESEHAISPAYHAAISNCIAKF